MRRAKTRRPTSPHKSRAIDGSHAALAAVATLAAIAFAIPALKHLRETPPPETRFEIPIPDTSELVSALALSPDGRQIVYVAGIGTDTRLWLRTLGTITAQPLAGTEGAQFPFWSPDSRSMGFFANGALKRLDLGGGTAADAGGDECPLGRFVERGRHHPVFLGPGTVRRAADVDRACFRDGWCE